MPNIHLLITDDDHRFYTAFREQYGSDYVFEYAGQYERGLDLIRREVYDAVLLDLQFIPKSFEFGLNEILPKAVRLAKGRFPILVVSNDDRPDTLARVLKAGASLFLAKSAYDPKKWDAEIRRAISKFSDPSTRLPAPNAHEGFITASTAMEAVKQKIQSFVRYPHVPILIRGETGVGKEALVRFYHAAKNDPQLPLKTVNVSALSEEIVASELFGHVKGSFTGALTDKAGYFESAKNGTLLFDEIGDLSLKMQVMLLTILGNRTFQRVGSTDDIRLEAQLVFATHVDLEEAVRQGRMRQDFYARFENSVIYIPPLCERREEILPLIEYFLPRAFTHTTHPFYGRPPLSCITSEALQILVNYDWPTNIRQLQGVIQQLVIDADMLGLDVIDTDLIPQKFKFPGRPRQQEVIPAIAPIFTAPEAPPVTSFIEEWPPKKVAAYLELQGIERALNACGWRKMEAAQALLLKNDQNIRSRILSCKKKFPEVLDMFPTLKKSYKI